MMAYSRISRSILALCVFALLAAQVLGLHHHRHVDWDGGASHASQLHFEDAGLHSPEGNPEHQNSVDGSASGHPHLDVETRVVGDGLAKVLLDLTWLAAFWVALGLLWPRASPAARPRPQEGRSLPPRYTLRPPSQAPPGHLIPTC